jgi:hypothetical protein
VIHIAKFNQSPRSSDSEQQKHNAHPGPIEQLQRQLDEFRSPQPHRTKLPETLWQAAVELARQHGVYSVAHPLRRDYTGLKKRLDGIAGSQKKATQPTFVELVADRPAPMADCVIEFEKRSIEKLLNLR